ncbi:MULTISPECIES: CinA family protein [unclassified Mesorhizobium]|uniref:CinA family protein n=1 Tax=unclassified Mesorhizobium TaxID=325217 RepID=UPI000BAED221|nr:MULTISPECIES: CinA family protein [unclassified Mesorhizobium]TGT60008.1 CinA family protein [Mesorhizobium sp. M00.F.Ca.ET.170.01.1.1]AZO08168.1 CinA family protein [Mesorhizobium sp. M3A.F.Ca.ET.080.04.2.1]PBB85764.1 damage-inducible protein CinA [Mesorhizobium sp. WSM3876]RWB70924.1 MAG: CinA family protein [Mesorhizobium sp.]RWB89159.1 MAG: CinA family protein [Mesorhizobium sp.]
MSNAELANALLLACQQRGVMLATAESCTGGMIIAALTDIAGSSAVVDRGFITYSNESKMDMLGVTAATLDAYGAVSRQTVLEMAAGALAHSRATLSLAVTGIAGPSGGSAEKPVGLVWFAVALAGQPVVAEHQLFAHKGREFIRHETVRHALQLGLRALGDDGRGEISRA